MIIIFQSSLFYVFALFLYFYTLLKKKEIFEIYIANLLCKKKTKIRNSMKLKIESC
jgi:hypothetical protein